MAKDKYKEKCENNLKQSHSTGKHTEYLSIGNKCSQVRDQRSVLHFETLFEIKNFNPVPNSLPNPAGSHYHN